MLFLVRSSCIKILNIYFLQHFERLNFEHIFSSISRNIKIWILFFSSTFWNINNSGKTQTFCHTLLIMFWPIEKQHEQTTVAFHVEWAYTSWIKVYKNIKTVILIFGSIYRLTESTNKYVASMSISSIAKLTKKIGSLDI